MNADTKSRGRSRRRRARQQDGAVMLVVLLIVMTATALAATSLQSTQFELRSSGYARAALQTEYVSEAAAMTTLAWIDATALDKTFWRHVKKWSDSGVAPPMWLFGEPEILKDNHADANRTQWIQQQLLTNVSIPPITNAGSTIATNVIDQYGTLGPRANYVAGIQSDGGQVGDYVVDLYDCRRLSNTATAGYQVNQGGSGTMQYFQLYCVVTSHGRTYLPYPGTGAKPTKVWTVKDADKNDVAYTVNRFTMAHDSRGAVITAPMSQ